MLPLLYQIASDISAGNLPQGDADPHLLKTILQIVFGIIGAIALLMIVVSGLRYILSGGNPDRISKAKDGIIFALIGLLVALTAEAIVSFVVKSL
jgi:hypothetical protein